jgi:hypothetical protein
MSSLPEVWVRVTGLPSDIITDYLSLWSVGTLFGKTLDVDMAYTRKNKVLRTKIGCLDSRLIPKDSDMFIRRGFLKLFFEVEQDKRNQEVDMVEANNGEDGNDDAANEDQNKEGGNDMDMDPKGQNETKSANNEVQNGVSINDGVQGLKLAQTEVNIGTIKIPITPADVLSHGKILSQNMLFSNNSSTFHFWLKNKSGADFHDVSVAGLSVWGLPQILSGSVPRDVSAAPVSAQPVLDSALPGVGRRPDLSACATNARAVRGRDGLGSSVVDEAPVGVDGKRISVQKIGQQGLAQALAPQQTVAGPTGCSGFSTPAKVVLSAHTANGPQKILSLDQRLNADPRPIGSKSLDDHHAGCKGSSAPVSPVAHGMDTFSLSPPSVSFSNMDEHEFLMAGGSLFHTGNAANKSSTCVIGLAKEKVSVEVTPHTRNEKNNGDDHGVGIASLRDIGNCSISNINELHSLNTCSITEISPDTMPANHTVEEVIAFGGIPRPSSGVRSSARLGSQLDGDMPQIDRAMMRAQRRDDPQVAGMSSFPKLSIINIPDSEVISRAESLGVSLGKMKWKC